jgi:hypothetical protein
MRKALAPVATLLIGVSILLTGQGLQGTLLPVRASLEAFSTLSIAVMGAAYFFGFTLGCIKGGELVKRVGHVRVFLAMTSLASAVPLLHGMVLDPVTWSLLRLLTGFCFAVLYLVIESWLNEQSNNDNRGIVFSTYVMITLTVFAALGLRRREGEDTEIEAALRHFGAQLASADAADVDVDERVGVAETHDERKYRVYRGFVGADQDPTALKIPQFLDGALRLFRQAQQALGVVPEDPARFGQRGVLGRPVEQSLPDTVLEPADGLADRGLRPVELHRRTRKAALAGDRQKHTEFTEFHRKSSGGPDCPPLQTRS